MKLKHIGVFSCGIVSCIMYACLGLIIGAFVSLFAMMGSMYGTGSDIGLFNMFFGVGAIIYAPLLYGFIGFIAGIITAGLYNFIAKLTGGLEIEFDMEMDSTPN